MKLSGQVAALALRPTRPVRCHERSQRGQDADPQLNPSRYVSAYQRSRTSGHPLRSQSSKREIPTRPQSAIVDANLGDIQRVRAALTAYGVKVPKDSRLDKAEAILQHAAKTGQLVPSHRGDGLGLRALEVAFDYSLIAFTLPSAVVATVRRELAESLTGDLDGQSYDARPAQLQSQYVARAALALGGLRPLHPTHSTEGGRKRPDLYVENGIATYAIESKRPRLTKNVVPRFNDARDQLDGYGDSGAVIVDATDCVSGLAPDEIDQMVERLAVDLQDAAFESGRGHRPGYRSIMLVGVVARAAWASDDGTTEAHIQVHTSSHFTVLAKRKNTLLDHHARWLRRGFQGGYEMLYRLVGEIDSEAAAT